LRKQSIFSH